MNSCGIADLLLPFEQLAHPLEVPLVALVADPAFLVLPVRSDALLGLRVHLFGADLHFERRPTLADHRGVQRLVAVGPRHRDEVLDAARHRRPGVVDDPERGVAVLDRLGQDAQRDEVVDLVEVDLLLVELLPDAVETLDAAVDVRVGHLRFVELGGDGGLQLVDVALRHPAPGRDTRSQGLVRLRLEVPEAQLLELVFHQAHPEPVGDRRVDVQRLLGNLDPPLLRQVVERAHVVQPVGQLDDDDADVVDHRQQHLAEVLGLALLARRKRDGADLGDALDDVGDLRAKQLLDALDGGQGVFDDVMEQAGGHGHHVQAHIRKEIGHFQGVHHVGLPRMANLSLVLEGRKHVGPAKQLEVGIRVVAPDLLDHIFEANHAWWCLITKNEGSPRHHLMGACHRRLDLGFFGSLYWPGFGISGGPLRACNHVMMTGSFRQAS